MKIDKDRVISDFELRSFGSKGWMHSNLLTCPSCAGGGDKFGIFLDEKGGGFYNCFRCESKGSIFKLFRQINKKEYILEGEEDFVFNEKLAIFINENLNEDIDLETKEIKKPIGFKFVSSDPYLNERGFSGEQYSQFKVGYSIDPRLKNKLTFLLFEDNKLVGYISRSKLSKEWHKHNLEKSKKGECKFVLRYDNSRETEFEKVVGGIDDIIEGYTDTVILVEGLFDKANTDRKLSLNDENEIKCCYTFGCKLSEVQMLKIFKKGVKNIILLYDADTINQVKSTSLKLLKYFDIYIGEIVGDKDPGDMEVDDFEKVLANLKTPLDYFANRISTQTLKF